MNHLNPLERQLYDALRWALPQVKHLPPNSFHARYPCPDCEHHRNAIAALAAAETPPEAPYYPDKGERYQTLVWGDVIEANASREDYERESTARIAIGKAPFKYRPAKEGGA